MTKYLDISSYFMKPFLINDFGGFYQCRGFPKPNVLSHPWVLIKSGTSSAGFKKQMLITPSRTMHTL
jgi:hypothetical protein